MVIKFNSFGEQTLQDFTVSSTEIFRRYVIKISLVIYLPMSLPTEYICRLFFRQ